MKKVLLALASVVGVSIGVAVTNPVAAAPAYQLATPAVAAQERLAEPVRHRRHFRFGVLPYFGLWYRPHRYYYTPYYYRPYYYRSYRYSYGPRYYGYRKYRKHRRHW